jgi:hypothetical protein
MCGGMPTEIKILLILSSKVDLERVGSVKEEMRFKSISDEIGFIK